MKKLMNFAYTGAIALLSAVFFAACSSSDETALDPNPTYNTERNEVMTQFVLNVAGGEMGSMRQASDIVQRNSNFRGMQDAKLVALSTGNVGYLAPYNGESTVTPAYTGVNKTFDLGTLYGSSAVVAANNETSSSNRVLELAMPLQTDAMLVYARAIPTTDKEANGQVTINIDANPEKSTFDLVSRINGRTTEYNQTCALGATILNRVLDANSSAAGAGEFTHNGYTNVAALPAINWEDISDDYKNNVTLSPLEEVLAKAYVTLTTINPGELRAGSGSALFSIFSSLYATATTVYGATATNDSEANAQRLAIEIRNRIGNYFNLVSDAVSEWKSIGNASETNTIIYNLISAGIVNNTPGDANYWVTKFGEVKTGDLKNLPTSFNLPFGSALLYLDSDGNFTYKNPSTSLLDQSKETAAANYMYPAELLYFDNSSLRVNDTEKKAADYPNGVNPWDTEATWTAAGWTTGAVASTTRSVAVKNNINYGVAMLQTKVVLDGTAFADNRHAIVPSESNQSLTADDVKQFKLTGILIGGQNHQLGWNYLAKANTSTDWDYVIYDNEINGTGAIPTPSGEENYTLVFDNYHPGAQADQTDVLVALEFENTSKDFYGRGNLIRYGGKFYLVGKLELKLTTTDAKAIADSNWPTYYAIPPYTSSGATNKITRVFVQDFMTTATFKIGANSLQNAFVTVPDLRSSQTSLGLSVDLKWQTGLSFEYTLGN